MTPEVSDYLDERIGALKKFVDEDDETARCDVEIGRTAGRSNRADDQWRAEFNLVCASGVFRTEAAAATVNAAIDEAKDELLRQLRKSKRKGIYVARRVGARVKRFLRWGSDAA